MQLRSLHSLEGGTLLYEVLGIYIYSPKGYGVLAILVRKGVSILVILVSNRVCFLHSSLERARRSYSFIKKALHSAFNIGLKYM